MYCPKCSHQAVSNNVRFCPGCGFRLDGIASPRGPTLPAAYSAQVSDPGQQFVDTAKVAQQSSITEQTTSRLNNM